jgi:hypothetical protein
MISKNIRTKWVLLNDWRKLDITEEQYAGLKLQLEDSKFSDPLVIKDADTWDIIFDWKVGAIKEFIHKKAKVNSWDVFICEFWNRHPLSQVWECDCKIEFDCMSFQFQDRLKEMWFNFDYPRFITDEMRIVYKKKYL